MDHRYSGNNSADYYLRRVEQARALAKAAADPTIKHIHMDFADRYALLAGIEPAWRQLKYDR